MNIPELREHLMLNASLIRSRADSTFAHSFAMALQTVPAESS